MHWMYHRYYTFAWYTYIPVSKLFYITKPSVMASFLCETTNFCVPFLRTCLLKSERICVQCTEHRLKFCMGLFRNSKNWAFCCNGHQKSHYSSPHRGQVEHLIWAFTIIGVRSSTGKNKARVPLILWVSGEDRSFLLLLWLHDLKKNCSFLGHRKATYNPFIQWVISYNNDKTDLLWRLLEHSEDSSYWLRAELRSVPRSSLVDACPFRNSPGCT